MDVAILRTLWLIYEAEDERNGVSMTSRSSRPRLENDLLQLWQEWVIGNIVYLSLIHSNCKSNSPSESVAMERT